MSSGGASVAESDGEGVSIAKQSETPAPIDSSIAAEGDLEAAEAATERSPSIEAGIAPTETDSIITEAQDETPSALTMEEETNFTDNATVADAEEARDETSETIADNA